ncbi:MAG: hypothetical protein J6A17_02905 [Bacilli bacterium]|nr:hypothetical protein [Bacilli bacterium]
MNKDSNNFFSLEEAKKAMDEMHRYSEHLEAEKEERERQDKQTEIETLKEMKDLLAVMNKELEIQTGAMQQEENLGMKK